MLDYDNPERRDYFRSRPHPGRRVEVEYFLGEKERVTTATQNIGIGGAFVVTPAPPPVGTPLELLVHLPSVTQPLEVKAEVRWHRRTGDAPGMGVKFNGLKVEEILALNEYFGSLFDEDRTS